MAQIHLLSSETINRIAAGEVVERPSGVVKELVENAIDAGASAITVEIRGGGLDLIRVTDNGCGIEPSQVRNAFLRHATSKIDDAEDLTCLSSLGFRGEALSSIAAVAEVEMITCTPGSVAGTRAVVTPGTLRKASGTVPAAPAAAAAGPASAADKAVTGQEPALSSEEDVHMEISRIGAPEGTSVIVRNLFLSVPVRRKFLKTPQTEAGYITDLVSCLALSHPDISFHYRKDGQEKLHTRGNGDERELIYRIYGKETARAVIPFEAADEAGSLSVKGWLGRPELSRSTRSFEYFFVNGRIAKSDVLSGALEEGYRTDLMQHRFPFAMIWLTAPASDVDVNIHPSKKEVRLSDSRAVYDLLNTSVREALRREELIPRATMLTRREEAAADRGEQRSMDTAQSRQPHEEPFERGPAPGGSQEGREGAVRPGSTGPEAGSGAVNPRGTVRPALDKPYESADAAAKKVRDAGEIYREDGFSFADKTTRYAQQSLFAAQAPLPDEKTAREREERRRESLFFREDGTDSAQTARETSSPSAFAPQEDPARDPLPPSYSEEVPVFTADNAKSFRYVGQIFGTYWIIEFQDKMLMIDQHAAHEKVNFERLMRRLERDQQNPAPSQLLSPPLIITLTGREEAVYQQYREYFERMGYEIEPFGENAYAIRAVPLELYANEPDALLRQTLDEILDSKLSGTPSAILYKIASMSCKAAVKGSTALSQREAEALIGELLQCDNPYHCPHGRPTMIVMEQSEIDRKFKRII